VAKARVIELVGGLGLFCCWSCQADRQQIRELLDSPAGKALYKLRQQIIEPIFGNIKHNLKYTMLHLRSLKKVNAEWELICLTHNIKQIWKLKHQVT